MALPRTATLTIPQDGLDSARLSLAELRREIAAVLYAQRRLSLGKARELADMSLLEFRHLLGSRGIPAHYETEDLRDDVAALNDLVGP